jgi:hypothetical protein
MIDSKPRIIWDAASAHSSITDLLRGSPDTTVDLPISHGTDSAQERLQRYQVGPYQKGKDSEEQRRVGG